MDIRNELSKKILFFDGGMGTQLQERGLAPGELPETWNLLHAEKVKDIHRAYLEAGADIVLSNTFGANRFKYPDNLEEIVATGVKNAKSAIEESGKKAYVALDIGPTGKLLKPLGTLDFEEAVSVFADVVKAGEAAGADLILIETMSDTYELKAAVLAAKENSSLPVATTVIFGEDQKMLTGCSPEGMVAMLEGLRVDMLGMNCGLGPKQMKPICERVLAAASIPVMVKPNAGLPKVVDGETVFDVGPEEFAEDVKALLDLGVSSVGGCCGTTPAHIKALTERCGELLPKPVEKKNRTFVSSYARCVELGGKPVIVGERINPTGKKKFKQALRDHNMEYILEEAVKQEDSGAAVLDVNVGLPEIDEPQMMKETVFELQSITALPLQIDTVSKDAMEQALRIYNGKPMVNSVNGKQEVMDEIFPLVAKYGGVVIGLTLDEDGIPDTTEGRLAIADKIYAEAAKYGIEKKDVVIDALTMTMSTDDRAAQITLDTVRSIAAAGGHTTLGVSNISFGLPQRSIINSSFFLLALEAGLSAGIINPNSFDMMKAYDTYCVLHGFDSQCKEYIEKYAALTEVAAPEKIGGTKVPDSGEARSLTDDIVKGLKEPAYVETQKLLETMDPMEIINGELVPALDIVGKGYEEGTMFLPQLLMSAEAAKAGFAAIKEHMEAAGGQQEQKATIVMATVKGDIHDIGKNIVTVLLENYGYNVVDLGKDVDPSVICEEVVKTKAPIAGLSALMTTTVANMEATIKVLREKAPWCKIMVGGAVLTQEYADMIGADFYGKDAMQSVYYAEGLYSEGKLN